MNLDYTVKKCETCMNTYPSIECVNCGAGFYNYRERDGWTLSTDTEGSTIMEMLNQNSTKTGINILDLDLLEREGIEMGVSKQYVDILEKWEDEACMGHYGSAWLEQVGEGVKFYAMKCQTEQKVPTFKGLISYIESMRDANNE